MMRRFFAWAWATLFGRYREVPAPPRSKPVVALPAPVTLSSPAPSAQRETAEPKPQPKPERTYRAKAFDCAGIRDAARAFLGNGLSTEQEGLAFAEAGAQAVAAGAGSRKSTTQVKRLLLMRHRLDVPLNDLSVFTFCFLPNTYSVTLLRQ